MINKRNIIFFSVLFIIIGCFIWLSIIFNSKSDQKNKSQHSVPKTTQVVSSDKPESLSGQDNTDKTSDSYETSTSLQKQLDVEQALSVFVSQKLNAVDVDSREKYLKNALTSTAFSGLQIELDSINVKKMIATYEEKNEFTSSSKSILANKEVTNVSIFRDVSNANYYYVEVKYTQTSPVMPNEKLSMVEKLNVSVDDDKISDIIVLSIETLKTDKE
ncbi:hypothetical protein GU336_12700 (plasmid) [Lactococcus raffinolactis]|jgi:hypothetical protein|uniref:Lipoprotein n=1 Tax=Pseudolactococcus raffinolactis TaxID=1366 RepID=A0A6H0UI90_9LACT|nr:hypothetical protein [Lactococcus raffinolactis]QIW55039.1 hypothetical protein GU336_12700 [Lactococcus raffinolactis]